MSDGYGISPTPKQPSAAERFLAYREHNTEKLPAAGAEFRAIAREAIKDVRQTMNEFFFSHGEHAPEPGTPMNLTQTQITDQAGNFHGFEEHAARAADNARHMRRDDGLER